MKKKVLFLCTENSCRSQIAEGFLRHLKGDDYEVFSAGTNPSILNSNAVKVMSEVWVDISNHKSKSVEQFMNTNFDFVVTVCDKAKESCPIFPGNAKHLHWSFTDPASAQGTEEEILSIFRKVRDGIYNKIVEQFVNSNITLIMNDKLSTMIEIKNLSYFYGTQQALDSISMNINKNEVVAIIGPSGCGKSSLIKAINRIGEISSDINIKGNVLVSGQDIYDKSIDVSDLRRRIGMVFQKPNPFPKSIFDNVSYGLKLMGMNDKNKIHTKVEKSLRQSGLWDEVKDRLNKSAMELSGGQQQRLCIARALAVDPEILLMDEPCSALDPIATQKIEDLIDELKQNYTIVIVTHNMQQAARVSNRTAFIYLGKLIEYDNTEKIFTQPEIKMTEDYITGRFG